MHHVPKSTKPPMSPTVLHRQPSPLPPLPDEITSEINTLINQNQGYIERTVKKHCELKQRLGINLELSQSQLHFHRRRDLRFIFESGQEILAHYMMSEYHRHQEHLDIDLRMSLAIRTYIRKLLDSFVEYSFRLPVDLVEDERVSVISESLSGINSSNSDVMSIASSRSSRSSSTRERDTVFDSEDSIEVQLEVFVPSVTFSEFVNCYEYDV